MSVSPLLEGDTITYDFQQSCYTKYILPLNSSFVVFKHLYCNERGNIVNNQRKKKLGMLMSHFDCIEMSFLLWQPLTGGIY